MLQFLRKIFLDVVGDASVSQPVEVCFEMLTALHDGDRISKGGRVVPRNKQTNMMSITIAAHRHRHRPREYQFYTGPDAFKKVRV